MKSFFNSIKLYFNFTGITSRKEFIEFLLFELLVTFVLTLIVNYLDVVWLMLVFLSFMYIPSIAIGWRRIRSAGKPGWYLFIPVISIFYLFKKDEV